LSKSENNLNSSQKQAILIICLIGAILIPVAYLICNLIILIAIAITEF